MVRLDSPTSIEVHVTEQTAAVADPNEPNSCALALTLGVAGYEALVTRHIALVAKPATRELLAHAKARGNRNAENVHVGDLVLWRYRLSKHATRARGAFDNLEGFAAGHYVLRAPAVGDKVNRDKRSATRKQRADAYRDGETPRYTRVTNLVRAAKVNAILRGEAL
jgi:hypothetical protein